MKKVLGFMMVLALASGVVACGGDDTNTDDKDIIVGGDQGKDVTQPKDIIGGQDVRDNGPQPVDLGPGTDNNGPVDPGPNPDPGKDPGTNDPGPNTDPGPQQGCQGCVEDPVGSCQAFFACSNECPQDASGQACVSECQGKMSATGLAEYQALRSCITQYCQNATTDEAFSQCLDQYCLEPYFGCFYGCDYCNCGDVIGCLNSCPDDNAATPNVNELQVCSGDCWGNASPAGQMDLQNAIGCSQDACPICATASTPAEEEQCNTCFNDSANTTCATQWEKCQSYGTATCAQTVQCLNGCGQDDEACVQACAGNMSKEARTQINAVYDCLDTACPQGSAETCYQEAQAEGGACYDEITTCMGQPTYGTATCSATVTCLNGCTDQTCQQNCVNNGSEAALTKLQAVFDCLDTACPQGSAETCYEEAQAQGGACYTQIQACMTDA